MNIIYVANNYNVAYILQVKLILTFCEWKYSDNKEVFN